MTGVSPIDSKLDRQGFIIVYNPLEKVGSRFSLLRRAARWPSHGLPAVLAQESYTAAQQLVTDLVEKMAKPEDENEDEKDAPAEVPIPGTASLCVYGCCLSFLSAVARTKTPQSFPRTPSWWWEHMAISSGPKRCPPKLP